MLGSAQEGHHILPMIGAVAGKLGSLNWGEILLRVAPVALTVLVVSGGMVKYYGDTTATHLNELFSAKMDLLKIEMERYADLERDGRFTRDMFITAMDHRDKEVALIAEKQDNVRERLIADLRADLERMAARMDIHLRDSSAACEHGDTK